MGVTRIRYLLDQWRLHSVAMANLQNPPRKPAPTFDWIAPRPDREPTEKAPEGREQERQERKE